MGQAPKIMEDLRLTREEQREHERKWFLDTTAGELKPEEDPRQEPQTRPRPVPAAVQTFD